ncbi:restriction endonuclease subunit R [Barnesiella sp. WM24]|uniref:type III restriction-modification system endonuclease n=1 Tax=Barnesiella sp. WM24 TaxID=2558278 RepID=UPI001072DA4E|nr:DEAD/DEAH box helicase family protein [Barnesiella sp. WM24]TFU92868.1 restriction endonuclease subunit R [Barnesiella sp. WM24]
MKLRYKHQRFQTEAARAVTNSFKGQPFIDPAEFLHDVGQGRINYGEHGFANAPLLIDRTQLTENVRAVQLAQGLNPIEYFEGDDVTLTVEMETGTGKTYTYIKTMYELNKLYGWTKFIIVVPSVAIREGVLKSFQTMDDHFGDEYGKRMQYFVYNSKQLSKIDAFATDSGMHCMIINTQAFNSSFDDTANNAASRIIFDRRDEFGSRRPIDVIAKTHPIMIIDEPQSVLGANKNNRTRQGLRLFDPLMLLLYSATHREGDIYNMVFRLDAIDAYNRKLVKKIEVKGISQVGSTATNGFLCLEEIVIGKGNPQARISFDSKTASGTKQVTRLVGEGYDLFEQSGGLAEYRDRCIVKRIDGRAGTVELLNGTILSEGTMTGNVHEDAIRREQIRETIRSHFERERMLFSKGIKVLSLFFIDKVENYRVYGSGNSVSLGRFAEIFEQEYINVLNENIDIFSPEYTLYLQSHPASTVHAGYFSQDKKGKMTDTKETTEKGRDEALRAYDLIMRNKERLLSFDEPVRFIFSHSALKEGWDNPNVFQICTLKDSDNLTKKRQEVGRGMRLCVNKNGERQDQDVLGEHVFDTNILTVIASESYEKFAKQLQQEIAEAVAYRPTVVTAALFEGRILSDANGNSVKITSELARDIHEELISQGYVKKGALTPKYHDDKRNGTLDFGDDLANMSVAIAKVLDSVFDPKAAAPSNGRKRRIGNFDADKFANSRFKGLWEQINVRSVYTVDFSSDELIEKSIEQIDLHLNVTEIHIQVTTGAMENIRDREALESASAMTQGKTIRKSVHEAVSKSVKYDLVGDLVRETGLTRNTIIRILKGISPGKFLLFRVNPEEFIIKVASIINDCKAIAVIKKITYSPTDQTFDTDLFTVDEVRGVVGDNAMESEKSLYDLVVIDSKGTEMDFAKQLESNSDVEVYTKLPRGFYINTPMGQYNPDWAIVFREGSVKHVYFIAETKGSMREVDLRETEKSKIACARRHFASLSNSTVKYDVVKSYQDLYNIVNNQ